MCGVKDLNTQKKLLVESGLTLEKAIKIGITDKAVNKDIAELTKARGLCPTDEVQQMKATSSKSKTNKEYDSQGGTNCKHCRKEIILQKNANSSMVYAINVTNKDTLHLFVNLQRNLKFMESTKNSQILKKTIEEFDDYLYLYNIQGGSENPIMIEIEIENQPVRTEFDTLESLS